MSKPTIYTIARDCGVSHATVSMALRNNPLVSLERRQQIQETARKVGYRPNRVARNLKAGSSKTLGFIIPNFTFPYYALISELVYREAALQGYQVQFVLSGSDADQESRAITECMAAQVDGIIVDTVASNESEISSKHALREVTQLGFPCVMVNGNLLGLPTSPLNHRESSALATRHLLDLGYKELRLLQLGSADPNNHKGNSPAKQSLNGFREELIHQGKEFSPTMVISRKVEVTTEGMESTNDRKLRYINYDQFESLAIDMMLQAVKEANGKRLGLVFGHDRMACAVWRYCQSNGIHVPQNIGIVGRGDIQTYMMPLTTIRWDYEEQAKRLVSTIISRIQGQSVEPFPPLKTKLIARESTSRAS